MLVLTELPENGQRLAYEIKFLLQSLAEIWANTMRRRPCPPLYGGSIRYKPEPWAGKGIEEWAMPWRVAKRGWGDCDDLVLYRVAELRVAGELATVQVMRKPGTDRFHVRVKRQNGVLEDPSIILGAKVPKGATFV